MKDFFRIIIPFRLPGHVFFAICTPIGQVSFYLENGPLRYIFLHCPRILQTPVSSLENAFREACLCLLTPRRTCIIAH